MEIAGGEPSDGKLLQAGDGTEFPRIVIVGAGISGLCLAIRLKQAGIHSFTILEKSDEVGGTWLDNSYPGCGCDVPSILYSYSFAPKCDWSRKFSPQSEILGYFRQCADRFDVRRHIRFDTSVTAASWDAESLQWRIETARGEELVADVFVSAVGQLSRPQVPPLEGLKSFAGPAFHSARWERDFEVAGRNIAVVGNGASAIQLIPQLAKRAKKVFIFQRSPNWIVHRHDYAYPRFVQAMFRWVPGVARLQRYWTYLAYESRILLYKRRSWLNNGFTWWARRSMLRKLPGHLQDHVIPRFPAGCKRVLLSNDYLECLHRENVQLVTEEIRRVVPDGIETDRGLTPVDSIVFATGFQANRFLYPMQITGRDNLDLDRLWQTRPRTYLGMMSPGFPNFFMLYGPNTNLGHNSIIFMVECQVNYLLRCVRALVRRGDQALEVRESVVEQFDRQLQDHLREKVWNGYVASWYKTPEGHIVNNWGGSTLAYWWMTRKPDWQAFQFAGRPSHSPTQTTASVA
ncbi:MAG: NAD(P)-binding domain-containing protein [Planctomycetales bacterium]|nr:NAD(P)-binding domain-containing protein [Planctomycetales bacterium]NIM08487.1 NAD(P)-binding domain-containing protein [Planctomycetales bacterium]NIN07964.1 NAD(P)-binding domain-containing protein [Planctomycetales bacterium]NIN77092.1 NAD(P)-binding domain-containing protein [Planctomycetales bacterium]NIO34270.1 NAD(P)-binding domain-containing protein [Planctomycetales bacterium]